MVFLEVTEQIFHENELLDKIFKIENKNMFSSFSIDENNDVIDQDDLGRPYLTDTVYVKFFNFFQSEESNFNDSEIIQALNDYTISDLEAIRGIFKNEEVGMYELHTHWEINDDMKLLIFDNCMYVND